MACFNWSGMALTIIDRTFVNVIITSTKPTKKTIPKACFHVYPSPKTIVYVNMACIPIDGARAYGKLAKSPVIRVPTTAVKIVAKKTPWLGIPVIDNTEGFKKMMYAIATNVVIPAITSVRTVVLFSDNLKKRSNMLISPKKILYHYGSPNDTGKENDAKRITLGVVNGVQHIDMPKHVLFRVCGETR